MCSKSITGNLKINYLATTLKYGNSKLHIYLYSLTLGGVEFSLPIDGGCTRIFVVSEALNDRNVKYEFPSYFVKYFKPVEVKNTNKC